LVIAKQPCPSLAGIRVGWSDRDEWRHLTGLALVGLVLAGGLAVLGLPSIDLHGPLHRFGIMDPLCGMTRGLRDVMLGQLGRAVDYNPASPVLVMGAIGAVVRGMIGRLSGRWLTFRPPPTRSTLLALTGALAALWVNQQLHAALLMG